MRPEPNDRPISAEDRGEVINALAKYLVRLAEGDLNALLREVAETSPEGENWDLLKIDMVSDLPEKEAVSEEEYNRLRAERWAEEFYRLRNDRDRKRLREQISSLGEIEEVGV